MTIGIIGPRGLSIVDGLLANANLRGRRSGPDLLNSCDQRHDSDGRAFGVPCTARMDALTFVGAGLIIVGHATFHFEPMALLHFLLPPHPPSFSCFKSLADAILRT